MVQRALWNCTRNRHSRIVRDLLHAQAFLFLRHGAGLAIENAVRTGPDYATAFYS